MQMKNITCPHCGKENTWLADNPFKPFCSERCKLIDLGKWADETHRIPGRAAEDPASEQENSDENNSQH